MPAVSFRRGRLFTDTEAFMIIYLKLFLTALFWGGTFVAARVVAQADEPSPAEASRRRPRPR
jgi:hypothetical protein